MLKPKWLVKNKREIRSIGIIAGQSKVGISLLPFLRNLNVSIKVYARHDFDYSRMQALRQDLCEASIEITKSLEDIRSLDCVIVLAGARTSRAMATKESLYELNIKALTPYMSYLDEKVVILATNPCTKIGCYLAKNLNSDILAVGIQNDFRRAKFRNPACQYVIGAHNIYEQIHFDVSGKILFDGFKSKSKYRFLREKQNKLISEENYNQIVLDLENFDPMQWWLTQRFHSQYGLSAYSCAESIVDLIEFLIKPSNKIVHVETVYITQDGRSVFLGAPLRKDHTIIDECLSFDEKFLEDFAHYFL